MRHRCRVTSCLAWSALVSVQQQPPALCCAVLRCAGGFCLGKYINERVNERVYLGGVEASWPNERQSDNTIQAAHSTTFFSLYKRVMHEGEEAAERQRGAE